LNAFGAEREVVQPIPFFFHVARSSDARGGFECTSKIKGLALKIAEDAAEKAGY